MSQAPRSGRPYVKWLVALLVIGALVVAGQYWRTSKPAADGPPPGAPGAPPGGGAGAKGMAARRIAVLVEPAKKQDVNVYLSGLGTVTSLNTVTVRSRVDGELLEILFKEGQMVKQGDVLARIDSRPYEAQLAQYEGQKARDLAYLENARLDLNRYKPLMDNKVIAKQTLDTQASLVRQYEGAVQADQALIDSAKLNISYCKILAPFTGRVGLRQVDAGNMIRSSESSGLAVITQVQPIAVVFTLPEDNLPQVFARVRAGQTLSVEAWDREQKRKLATGALASNDNQIDATTGTLKFKASFANENFELFPNQFVNAKLLVDTLRDAVTAPPQAVQRGQKGPYVYVVDAERNDKRAVMRSVTLADVQGGPTVFASGLAAGELVVVDGADRLRDGAQIELRDPNAGNAAPGGSPSGKPGQPEKTGQGKPGQGKPAAGATKPGA
jgi:multidrug efflux system membrane fusion protein